MQRPRVPAVVLATISVIPLLGEQPVTNSAQKQVRFRFSDREVVVTLVDNSASRSLLAMLPMTLKFEDYAGVEKISHLPRKLDTSDVPPGYDPAPGDLTL